MGKTTNTGRCKTWYQKNKHKEWIRKLKQHYQLSLEGYNKIFIEQNGCCAICKTHQSELKFALGVDHNHKCCASKPTSQPTCGKCVRGLLCKNCNTGIGLLKDDPEIIQNAVSYLPNDAELSVRIVSCG